MADEIENEDQQIQSPKEPEKQENKYDPEEYTKVKYIAPFIVLVAALVVCIIDIRNQVGINTALWHLIITVVIFYLIGYGTQRFIFYTITKVYLSKEEEKKEPEEEESEENVS